MTDVTWIRFCELEDEYLVFLDAQPPPELDNKSVETIKRDRFVDVCLAFYAYHKAHSHLSQEELENLLRKKGRHTYLIVGAPRENFIPFGQQTMFSFGEQATYNLNRELCVHTTRTRDEYHALLKSYGHCSEEENRLLLGSAGFVVPSQTIPTKSEVSTPSEHKTQSDE